MAVAATTLLETTQVSPPPPPTPGGGGGSELSLPLKFFDMIWLHFIPIRCLLFYRCPAACSTRSHFLNTLLPNLKRSLSFALRHYLPVAGNLLYPLLDPNSLPDDDDEDEDQRKPFFRYVPGDSVTLTVSESSRDFDDLIGDHPRDADQFYDFVPQMPPLTTTEEGDYNIVPVMAIQVTLFPNRGICIGFANHHSLGDASSIVRFIRAWAEISRLGGDDDEAFLNIKRSGDQLLPVFDRSEIKVPVGLDSIFWKAMRKNSDLNALWSSPLPTNKVRATYTLGPSHIKGLKNLVSAEKPGLLHVSSFVVTTSYAWTCLVKSGDAAGEDVADYENVFEHFTFTVDIRGRLDPPVPANYFGNCLNYGMARIEHKALVGKGGFLTAAAAIAEDIQEWVNKKGEALRGIENWISDMGKFEGIRVLGVSGSPRFDLLAADFGWGRARKMELVSIDGEKYSMSLSKSSTEEGGIEVGISLPKTRMEAFAAIFYDGLRSFQ